MGKDCLDDHCALRVPPPLPPPLPHCSAKLRVNASNRTEGFVTLPGLPADVMIRGETNQNR
jgi:hypothetical protein